MRRVIIRIRKCALTEVYFYSVRAGRFVYVSRSLDRVRDFINHYFYGKEVS